MGSFEDREKAAEQEYVARIERPFRLRARMNGLLASWVGELTGLSPEDYLHQIVSTDLVEGENAVFRKLADDLKRLGTSVDHESLRAKMQEFRAKAAEEVDK